MGGCAHSGLTKLSYLLDCHEKIYCGPSTNVFAHPSMWVNDSEQIKNFKIKDFKLAEVLNLENKPYDIKTGITYARFDSRSLSYNFLGVDEIKSIAGLCETASDLLDSVMSARSIVERSNISIESSNANIYSISQALESDPSLKAIVTIRNPIDTIKIFMLENVASRFAVVRWFAKATIIKDMIEKFGEDRVHVVKHEELYKNHSLVLKKVCNFLNVSDDDIMEKYSLRMKRDNSISVVKNNKSLEVYSKQDIDETVLDRNKKLQTRDIQMLNSLKLSTSVFKCFGVKSDLLSVRELSAYFGYTLSIDTQQHLSIPLEPFKTSNRFYKFWDDLIQFKQN